MPAAPSGADYQVGMGGKEMAKIYQLYYTRLGKQGSNAGWQTAAASQGIPQLVKNSFNKLASNLVAAAAKGHVPPMAFDLQMMENYVFLSHINYASVNEGAETDARGISFIHGFAIHAEEYRELVKKPEQVLGISSEEIMLNYNGKKELPLLGELSHGTFSKEELLGKYHLDQKRFNNLMGCVYAAMGTVGGSLVVRSSGCPGEGLRTLFREMTWLVMEYMPYILRMKVSAFSGIRQGVMLCFSDVLPEKGNWFDLDTGESHCPAMPKYEFIELLNHQFIKGEHRIQYYSQLEEFVTATYGGNYEALKLNHMELAYRGSCIKPEWNLKAEELDEYIREATSLKAYRYDKLDGYYAVLIRRFLDAGRQFPAQEVLKKLQRRYVETDCQDLKEAFEDYYVENACLPGAQPAYEMLYRMKSMRPEDYKYLYGKLEDRRPEFLRAYQVDYYLEREVKDYEGLEEACKGSGEGLGGPLGEKLLEIMVKVFKEEVSDAQSNTERYQVCQKYDRLCASFPESLREPKDACVSTFREEYWKRFREEEFCYLAREEYVKMGAGMEKWDPMVPRGTKMLLEARRSIFSGPNTRIFRKVFFTNEAIGDEAARQRLMEELHEEARKDDSLSLDACLLLNSRADGRFDLKQLLKDLGGSRNLGAGGSELGRALNASRILAEGSKDRERFIEQVKAEVKGGNPNRLLQNFYQLFFPPRAKEDRLRMADLVQKCQLFLAASMAYVVLVKYFMGEDPANGIIVLFIGVFLSVPGLAALLVGGNTNSLEFLMEGDREAIIWTAVFAVLSAAVLTAAWVVCEIWMMYLLTASAFLLLAGRLILKLKICYEVI